MLYLRVLSVVCTLVAREKMEASPAADVLGSRPGHERSVVAHSIVVFNMSCSPYCFIVIGWLMPNRRL
jgi:hypothetical protein